MYFLGCIFFTLKSVFLIQFLNDQKAAYKQNSIPLTFQYNWPRSPRISKFIITERSLQIGIFLCPTKTRCRALWHFFDCRLPIPRTSAHSCNDEQASQTSVQLAKSNVWHKSVKWNTNLMQHCAGFISAESLYMFRAQAPIIRTI